MKARDKLSEILGVPYGLSWGALFDLVSALVEGSLTPEDFDKFDEEEFLHWTLHSNGTTKDILITRSSQRTQNSTSAEGQCESLPFPGMNGIDECET